MPEEFPRGVLTRVDPNAESGEPAPFPTADEVVAAHYESGDFERATAVAKKEWSRKEIREVAEKSLAEMRVLEGAAHDRERWKRITPEVAKSIQRIIVFSAPGTYSRPVKEDRYKDKQWAWGMDRLRDDRAARLGIVLAGITSGKDLSSFDSYEPLNASDPTIKDLHEKAKAAVGSSLIRFTYLGRPDEAEAVREALRNPLAFIPEEKVDIISGSAIDTTVDQARALKEYLAESYDIGKNSGIVLVSHSPHLVRAAGMLNKFESVPPGIAMYVEPLPIPRPGMHEFPFMEAKGKLFYTISGASTAESCPYKILGNTE